MDDSCRRCGRDNVRRCGHDSVMGCGCDSGRKRRGWYRKPCFLGRGFFISRGQRSLMKNAVHIMSKVNK